MIRKEDLCTQQFGNTGYEACQIDLNKIVGLMILPKTLEFSAANIASDPAFITAMQTATTVASKSLRLFPFLGNDAIADAVDNTADPAKQTTGYGRVIGVTYGKHDITLTIGDVGLHAYQQFYKYKGNKNVSFAWIDDSQKVLGRKTVTGGLKGMSGQLIPSQYKQAVGAAVGIFTINIILDEEDAFENENKLIVYPFNGQYTLADLISGVHDVNLSLVSATTTTATIQAQRSGDFANMAVEFATGIVAPTAWVITNKATGAAVVPSGITISPLGYLVFAGLTLGTTYLIQMAAPAVLLGATILIGTANTGGYESNQIEVTTPAA